MKADALLNKMHHSLAEVKAETPVCTVPVVDANTSANKMADRLAEVKGRQKFRDTDGCEGRSTRR